MATLEVFFDYSCPFCMRGHDILLELLPQFPQMSVEWHPCEAHPRPEHYGLHSDLLARGMFYAQEQGVDLMEYHCRSYRGAVTDREDIENPRIVAKRMEGLLDSKELYVFLTGNTYTDRLLANNRLAWESCRFPAVPSYRMEGRLLNALPNIGVTQQRLQEFLTAE